MPSSKLPLTLSLAALLAAGSLAAQTFIVDSANGPGTNFTDLPIAVSTVPGGATLHVRPGSYSSFSVANKSLTIVGHRSASGVLPSVNANALFPGILVGSIGPGQAVTISGLGLTGASLSAAQLSVSGCTGPVVLEDVACSFQLPFTLRITNSANVHLSKVTVSAFVPTTATPANAPVVVQNSSVAFSRLTVQGYRRVTSGGNGTAGIEISQQSRVLLVDSNVAGGAALVSNTAGGPGVIVTASTLHAYGNAGVTAGGISGGAAPSGAGGDGLVLAQGSFARVRGIALAGGFGFPAGQPLVSDASSSSDVAAADVTPSGLLAGTVQPGNVVRYTLHARPGASAALLVGVTAQFVPAPFLTLGAFELIPIVSLGAGTVPATGRLEIASSVPTGWPDDTVVLAQFLTFHPTSSEFMASNLFTVTSSY